MSAALLAMRGKSLAGALLGAAASVAAADELPPRTRRLRSLLPASLATNVLATLGPADATRTVVVLVHHDSAHAGLVFHPAIPNAIEGAQQTLTVYGEVPAQQTPAPDSYKSTVTATVYF